MFPFFTVDGQFNAIIYVIFFLLVLMLLSLGVVSERQEALKIILSERPPIN